MQKLKITNLKIIFLSLIILLFILLSTSVSAQYFRSGLVDYIQANHQLTVPIFSPTEKIEIRAEEDTVLTAAGAEDFRLEAGQLYFISQGEVSVEASGLQSGYGIQLMASSEAENAAGFREQLQAEFNQQVIIKEEDGLYKVIAGAFAERSEAEVFEQQLAEKAYDGWIREIDLDSGEANIEVRTSDLSYEIGEGLNFYSADGQKLREAHVFKIDGKFEAKGNQMEGEFNFGPLGNSVLFSYKTNIEELTAYMLQNVFNTGAPEEALKAQAVIYRTSLLYQIETQGARLSNLNSLNFNQLDSVFKKAVEETSDQVMIRGEEFFYNSDFALRQLRNPRTGIVPLAQADYSYSEIIKYYYERSDLAQLRELVDREEKLDARVSRGLHFKEIREMTWNGPRVLTVIDYDLGVEQLKLKPVLAQGVVPGREDLGDIIRNNSALAGINGGYFHYSGRPLGLLYIDDQIISEPLYNRSALLIDQDNEISISQVEWEGKIAVESYSDDFKIQGVNRGPSLEEAVLFNSFYGSNMSSLPENYYDIVIRSDEILGVENQQGTNTPIPPDGYIIRVGGDRADLRREIPELRGKKVELINQFTPDFKEKNIIHAIGGGPRLLEAGEINITGEEERFQKDILFGRAPRTAIGITADNRLLMLTIDGRQAGFSIGMSLEELAQALKDLGAVEAVNFDGGGSARMVIRGFTMSNPTEKRLISNGVIVNSVE